MPTSKQIKDLNALTTHGPTDKILVQQTTPSPYDTHAIFSQDLFTQAMVNGVGTLTSGNVSAHQMRIAKDGNTYLDITVLATGEITLVPNVAAGSETEIYAGFTLKPAIASGNTIGFLQVQKNDGTVALSVDNLNSRVGVNKAAPTKALDVAGSVLVTPAADAYAFAAVVPSGTTGRGLVITNNGTGDSIQVDSTAFIVDGAGNVGIGIDPANPLSVFSTAVPQVRISFDAEGYATLGVIDGGHLELKTYENNSNIYLTTTGTNGNILLTSTGTGDIYLTSTENIDLSAVKHVDIGSAGTTAPNVPGDITLHTDHVQGQVLVNSAATTVTAFHLTVDALTSGVGMKISSNSPNLNTTNDDYRELLYVHQDRAEAFRATALYVKQDSTVQTISGTSYGPAPAAFFDTTGVDTTINSTGIGINTTAPLKPLHVKTIGGGERGHGAIYLESPNTSQATAGPYIMFEHNKNPRAYILGTSGGSHDNAQLEFGVGDPVSNPISTSGNAVMVVMRRDGNSIVDHGRVSIGSGLASNLPDATLQIDSLGEDSENVIAVNVTSNTTTKNALKITANSLTSGDAAWIYSNSDAADARSLLRIDNEHPSADATDCIEMKQDGGPNTHILGAGTNRDHGQSSANFLVGRYGSTEYFRVDNLGRTGLGKRVSNHIDADLHISSEMVGGATNLTNRSTTIRLSETTSVNNNWDIAAWDGHTLDDTYSHSISFAYGTNQLPGSEKFWIKPANGDARFAGHLQLGQGSSTAVDGVLSYRTISSVTSLFGKIGGVWVDLGASGLGTVSAGLQYKVAYYPNDAAVVDDTSALYWKSNRLGVNEPDPEVDLHIKNTGTGNDAAGAILRIERDTYDGTEGASGEIGNGDVLGEIQFWGKDYEQQATPSTFEGLGAKIVAKASGVWAYNATDQEDRQTQLEFHTCSGVSSEAPLNRLTIEDSGVIKHEKATYTNFPSLSFSTSVTIDLDASNLHKITLENNITFAFSNSKEGQRFIVRVLQDGSGNHTIAWPSGISWAGGGTPPTHTATSDRATVLGFLTTGAGSSPTYDGFLIGKDIVSPL